MPELPEVETICQGLRPHIINQTIRSVLVRNPTLRNPLPDNLSQLLSNQTVCNLSRRAKYLIFSLTDGIILSHLGMSGTFKLHNRVMPPAKHDHIILSFHSTLHLHYNDSRRFGQFDYYPNANLEQIPTLTKLGPEPLTRAFSTDYLASALSNRSIPIKTALMTNAIVVGIGNIYAQESLFKAGISPLIPANALSRDQIKTLISAIKLTLKKAIAAGGTTLKDFSHMDGKPGYFAQQLSVYCRAKLPCLSCTTPILKTVQAGRSTHFCPKCQPAPKN